MHFAKTLIHSVLSGLILVAIGCGQTETPPAKTSTPQPAVKEDAHGHSHGSGPHDGSVADWGGGKYHVEFTVDHDKQEATVYLLGSDAKTATPVKAAKLLLSIKQPIFQVDLTASPLEGETNGMSSRFVGKHEKLGVVQEFGGTISGEVDGKPYAGDFQEEPHSDQK